ncbi:cell wall-active antibiotics response protein LiaF [Mesobacillus subterraneus]|uniref:Cell wall-active antibiotics response LiaF-like C-terminal domain-containing protein n=1 Tax=Mesobacillus subterraneus TaxID=285983 RepID=A0A427TXS1_9BACI|nr:cell wall-active antibiotics response protein LiaF [Mesobacillus subterraneus]RSD29289.1 hypothetical protein EJA10_01155 [Mesobacillus subterraneus]
MRNHSMNQIAMAVILSGLGIILLLVNLGIISLQLKELFVVTYPFILFIYGLAEVIKRQYWWGSFVMIFSGLLILDRLGIISFQFLDIWKLWPLLLVYLGFSILFQKKKVKVIYKTDLPSATQTEEIAGHSMKKIRGVSVGKVTFKKQNWAVEPMDLYNMVGDYFIDFSKAFIPERETPIKVRGWVGEVRMLIPEDIPVKINATVGVGEVKLFDYAPEQIRHVMEYKSDDYDDAVRKLNITIELKIGSVRLDRV